MAVIEAIQTTYLEADAALVLFENIPATYEHLQLRISAKDEQAGDYLEMTMQFGVGGVLQTGSNYWSHRMYGYNTTAGAAGGYARAFVKLESASGTTANTAQYGGIVVDILDYVNPNKNTTIMSVGGTAQAAATPWVAFSGGLWDGTGAIDTLGIGGYLHTNDLLRGTEISLYGIQE